jgi:MFS family permease
VKSVPWRDFLALVASIGVVGLGLGATIPLTALTLDARAVGTDLIGMVTAASAIGILASTPLVPHLVGRFGPRKAMMGAVLVAALSTTLMQANAALPAWTVLRFLFGGAMGVLFTIGEAWVNRLAPGASRGRVVALYTTSFTLFQLAGPVLVASLDAVTAWPFAACGALFLLALPGLSMIAEGGRPAEDSAGKAGGREQPAAWRSVLPRMPMIVAGAAFFALFDTLILSLLPVYALRQGIATGLALLSATVVLVGDTGCQFALGWLADRIGRFRVHLGCGVAVVLLLPALPFAAGMPWLWWTLLLLLGAAAGGIYMLSLVACGERFTGQPLVAASAIVNASWGVSSSAGPLLAGASMRAFGIHALPAVLWLGAAAFVATARWERRADGMEQAESGGRI